MFQTSKASLLPTTKFCKNYFARHLNNVQNFLFFLQVKTSVAWTGSARGLHNGAFVAKRVNAEEWNISRKIIEEAADQCRRTAQKWNSKDPFVLFNTETLHMGAFLHHRSGFSQSDKRQEKAEATKKYALITIVTGGLAYTYQKRHWASLTSSS